jgi:hypothetical protein
LEGVVTDPQGAVVPTVHVVVTSVDTNVSVATTTNSSGYYSVVDLVPGRYKATFTAQGFAPITLTDILVDAGKLMRQDVTLNLGASLQQVTVSAEVPLLETSASNFSTTLETRTVQEIPLQGRDLQQLVFLVPGVNSVAGPPGSNFGFDSQYGTFPDPMHRLGSDLSVNGGQGGANAWYLDGNLNLASFAENVAVNPSPDTVQEFQAITNAFSAEYSRTGGAVFNVVLRSGTNSLHGNVYEYVRNDATNARNPFTSIDSQGNIIQHPLRFNNFGGTLGGPVVLPHLYNGRDRTFFFFSWDTSILHRMGSSVFTVPTQRMRNGDFSEDPSVVSNGLWDPFTTAGPDKNGLFARSAFGTPLVPNGCTGYIDPSTGLAVNPTSSTCQFSTQIPAGRLDPTAMFFMKSFPAPNYFSPLAGCDKTAGGVGVCSNFLGDVGSSQDSSNISIKIDHQWSDKSKYFGEWLYNPGTYNNYRVPWTGPTFPWSLVGFGSNFPLGFANQIIALGNTYSLRPTLINEFRASFSRQYMTTHPSQPYPDSVTGQSQVQQELAPLKIPQDPFFPMPTWDIGSPEGGSITFGPEGWVNMNTGAEAYTILDNVTKIMGKHTLKTGFLYRLEHTAYESGFPTTFNFGWNGAPAEQVVNPITGLGGSGLAQFMLGGVSSQMRNSSTGVMWKPYERFRYWGLYVQDDYRVTPRLTLNVGLRWDIYGLYKTRQHPNSNFCLGCPNSTTGLPGKVIYEGDPRWPMDSDIAPANKDSFGPRFNFSWTPFADRKTIVRGGYDIFYSNAFAEINSPGQAAANAPGWNQEYDWEGSFYPSQCTPLSGQCVAFPLSDTTTNKANLTTPPLPSTFPAQNRASLLGIGLLQFFTPPSRDPMVQTWNFGIERQLPSDMMVSVGYVGSHGTHLVGEPFRQFNYIHTADLLKYRTAIYSDAPINHFYSGQTAALLAQVYNAGQDANGNYVLPMTILLKQYPFYGALSSLQNNTAFDGTSIYHALNVGFQKRYSHGLNITAAYTAGKLITNAEYGELATMLVDPIAFARAGGIGGRAGVTGWSGGFGGAFQNQDNKKVDRAVGADDVSQMFNLAATYQLPFGTGRAFLNRKGMVNQLVGGWLLTGNFNAETGVPLPVTCPNNQINNTNRCNLIGDPHFHGNRSRQQEIAQWINPAAFSPAFGTDQSVWGSNYDPNADYAWAFGTMGPRLSNMRSPGFWTTSASLAKRFSFSERKYFEFRWEVFNAFNHQSLGFPNTSFCLPPLPDGTTDKVHQAGCTFGRITNIQTDPRSMEFALKFFW